MPETCAFTIVLTSFSWARFGYAFRAYDLYVVKTWAYVGRDRHYYRGPAPEGNIVRGVYP